MRHDVARPPDFLVAAGGGDARAGAVPGAAAEVDFSRDVLPILSTNCFPCHGPDAAKRKADFRLDDRQSATHRQGDRARKAGVQRAARPCDSC